MLLRAGGGVMEGVNAQFSFKDCRGASNTRVRPSCVREKELRSNSDLKFTAGKKKVTFKEYILG